jgi:hypothetical protein
MIPRVRLPAQSPATIALGATVALAAALLAARYLYLPVIGTIIERQSSLNDLEVKVGDASVLSEALPKHEASLAQAETRFRALEGRVGQGQSVARVLEGLGKWAKDHRIDVVSVQPGVSESVEASPLVAAGPALTLRTVPIALRLRGRYRQLGEFLGKLPSAPFVSAVRRCAIHQPSPESPQLEADVVLAVYFQERQVVP